MGGSVADEVDAGVVPGGKVAAAAQLLAEVGGGGLAHMVDEEDGDVELALEGAQRAEHGRDLLGAVLVHTDYSYKWIEHQEAGAEGGDRAVKAPKLDRVVKAERGQVDEVDRGVLQGDAACIGDRLETGAHRGQVVLGGSRQGPARLA